MYNEKTVSSKQYHANNALKCAQCKVCTIIAIPRNENAINRSILRTYLRGNAEEEEETFLAQADLPY